jgi:ankyrin repeat protein
LFLGKFDDLVIRQLLHDVRADDVKLLGMGQCYPPMDSASATATKLLSTLVYDWQHEHRCRSPHALVNTVCRTVDKTVDFFCGPSTYGGLENPEELKKIYTDAIVSVLVGVKQPMAIMDALAGENDRHDLDGEEWRRAALMTAAYLGRLEDMEALLQTGDLDINADSEDKWLCPPLMAAALGGRVDVIRFLAGRGVDMKAKTRVNGNTALHYASFAGKIDAVRFLLDNGADAEVKNNKSDTPLAWASNTGHADVVSLLQSIKKVDVSHGDCGRNCPLVHAVRRGHMDVVRILFRTKHVDGKAAADHGDEDGDEDSDEEDNDIDHDIYHGFALALDGHDELIALLCVTAYNGKEEMFQLLLSLILVDRDDMCVPLEAAIKGEKIGIVRTIMETFPHIPKTFQAALGRSVLMAAVQDGSEEMVRYFLTFDEMPINEPRLRGRTPLHRAVESGDAGKVSALLAERHMNVNGPCSTNRGGATPLHCAIGMAHPSPDILRALLDHPRINVNCRNNLDTTPLAFAVCRGNIPLVKTLLARNDVEREPVDIDGHTPLVLAAWLGNLSLLEIFLGIPWCSIWHRNGNGKTALALAAEEGHVEVVKRLLDPRLGATGYILDDAVTVVNLGEPEPWYYDGDGWVRRGNSALEAAPGRREEIVKLILDAYNELGMHPDLETYGTM